MKLYAVRNHPQRFIYRLNMVWSKCMFIPTTVHIFEFPSSNVKLSLLQMSPWLNICNICKCKMCIFFYCLYSDFSSRSCFSLLKNTQVEVQWQLFYSSVNIFKALHWWWLFPDAAHRGWWEQEGGVWDIYQEKDLLNRNSSWQALASL